MQPVEKRFENVFGIEGMNIILIRAGQNRIEVDDEIRIKAVLELPGINGEILESLRFMYRIEVFEEPLITTWGNQLKSGSRYKSDIFSSEHWKTAFDNAEYYAFQEAKRLKDAVDARNQALIDAEKDE
jgi:hypothetical protein